MEAQIRPIGRTRRAVYPDSCRPQGRLATSVAACVLALVVLGSLTPFDLRQGANFSFTDFNLGQLTWKVPSRADLAANFAVYLPVGFILFMATRRKRSACASWFVAGVAGAVLSLAIEITQTALASRWAAWFDVLLNTAGAIAGASIAMLSYNWLIRCAVEIRARWHVRPAQTAASALTLAVIVTAVAPFEFVTSTDGLHAAFRQARVPLPVVVQAGRLVPGLSSHLAVTASHFDLNDAATLLIFAVLGACSLLARRERGACTARALVGAATSGWILAVAVESLQLFSTAHAFDMLDLVTEGASATAGALLAAALTRGIQKGNTRRLDWRHAPIGVTAAAWCISAAMVLALSAGQPDFSISRLAHAEFNWVPFADQFTRSLDMALWSMLEVTGACAALALCTVWLASRMSNRATAPLVLVTVLSVAAIGECLHAVGPANSASISNLYLAVIAAWLTLSAVHTLGPCYVPHNSQRWFRHAPHDIPNQNAL